MKLNASLKMSQKLVMTPMLQQAIKLLPLARLELAQQVRKEIMENPILEEIHEDEQLTDDKEINEEIESPEPQESFEASETLTGNTMPSEPLATKNSRHFANDLKSIVLSSLKGVTGIEYTPE